MKLNKLRVTLESFEELTEKNANQLVGGFSKTFSDRNSSIAHALADNCHGGNCTSGCGSGSNTGTCNTAMGCGQNVTGGCG